MASTSWQLQLHRSGNNTKKFRKTDGKWQKRKEKRPPWDSSSSDLSVLKPTREELNRRHELHKPKPLSERQYIQQYQDLMLLKNKENIFPRKTMYQENVEQKKALIKEIFHHQEMELSNVLAETDKAMANVKDLFGDYPMKFRGVPHITDAPDGQSNMNRSLLAVDMETPSRLTALSESVMRHPALNDVTDDVSSGTDQESDVDENNSARTGIISDRSATRFQSDFNFDYYKELLQREQFKKESDEIENSRFALSTLAQVENRDLSSNRSLDFGKEVLMPSKVVSAAETHGNANWQAGYSSSVLAGAPGTENQPYQCKVDPSGNMDKITEMRQVLDAIESELQGFEAASDKTRKPTREEKYYESARAPSLSKVLNAVVKYVKELTKQVETDRELQSQLMEEFQEQRALIDALTGDLICSQEENELLKDELEKVKSNTSEELSKIKKELHALALVKPQSPKDDET
ncbi:spindle and centriole-associated protein 1-like [Rhopilema esculentum]|uniref:spindle and centriole-associated protein 1-like n=1 Tax=Rhopilema esculentum TaxID=499914 RepID=UPI0031E395E7